MANLNETIDSSKKSLQDVNTTLDSTKSKVQEYEASWEKVGSTANTALGLISASLKSTNPALSSALGSVQKLIPNLTELGNAAKKTGSLLKAAFSSAGIMLLINLITTLITDFDNITEALGITTEQANKFKDAIVKIGGVVGGVVNIIVDNVKKIISVFKKIFKGDFKGAFEEIKTNFKDAFKVSTYVDSFKEGQKTGENMAKGILSKKKDIKSAAQEAGEDIAKTIEELVAKALTFEGSAQAAAKKSLDDFKKFWDEYTKSFTLNNPLSQLDESEVEDDNEFLQGIKDREEAEQAQYDARIENYKNFLDTYASLSNTITDAIDKNLEAELNAGKITEKEYKRKKKALQAFSIASIVASTASGLVDVWTGYAAEKKTNAKSAPDPITLAALNTKSLIAAIAQSALLTATAATSIGSVKSETLSGSTPSANATAAPSISYISNPSYQESVDAAKTTASYAGQTNIVPVLVVDDVNKVQNDMTVVQTNSSF